MSDPGTEEWRKSQKKMFDDIINSEPRGLAPERRDVSPGGNSGCGWSFVYGRDGDADRHPVRIGVQFNMLGAAYEKHDDEGKLIDRIDYIPGRAKDAVIQVAKDLIEMSVYKIEFGRHDILSDPEIREVREKELSDAAMLLEFCEISANKLDRSHNPHPVPIDKAMQAMGLMREFMKSDMDGGDFRSMFSTLLKRLLKLQDEIDDAVDEAEDHALDLEFEKRREEAAKAQAEILAKEGLEAPMECLGVLSELVSKEGGNAPSASN